MFFKKKCPNCGAKNPKGVTACAMCGSPFPLREMEEQLEERKAPTPADGNMVTGMSSEELSTRRAIFVDEDMVTGMSSKEREERVCWRQFCSEIDADIVKGESLFDHVVKVKNWTITLETYEEPRWVGSGSKTYTRMRAPLVSKEEFRFTIYCGGSLSRIGKLFRRQDIEVGYPEFDSEFVIKGNDESKVRALFANPRIRRLIQAEPSIYFQLRGASGAHIPKGPYELYARVKGFVKDPERVKSLHELFVETLNQLCDIGSASEDDPITVFRLLR